MQVQELRFAIRTLRKSPTFSIAVITTMALAIGCGTAVFSLVDALLWKGTAGIDLAGRVAIDTVRDGEVSVTSYLDFVDLRAQNETFVELAAFKPRAMDIVADGRPERIEGMLVTSRYFATLGVAPALGRFFRDDEAATPGSDTLAVISYGLWQRRFAGALDVVGSTIRLNARDFTVIGVTPQRFRGSRVMERPQVFVPMTMQAHFMPLAGYLLDRRSWGGTLLIGALRPGVSIAGAQADIDTIAARLALDHPRTNATRTFLATDLRQATLPPWLRPNIARMGTLLLAGIALVFLIASLNVSNLMLARAQRRRREIAIRQAIGAGRGGLTLRLLLESLLLAVTGGALGLLLAWWTSDALELATRPLELDVVVDWRVAAFAFGASIVACVIFGLAPSLRAARVDLVPALKLHPADDDRRRGRIPLSGAMIVGQVALSFVLLVAAALFGSTLHSLTRVDPGFSTTRTLVGTLDPALQGRSGEAIDQLYAQVVERVAALAGVEGVSLVSALPGPGNDDVTTALIEGTLRSPDEDPLELGFGTVGLGYFDLLDIPILEGRPFASDDRADGAPVVVVNQAAARIVSEATGRPAVGRRIGPRADGPFFEIVGVAADSRLAGLRENAHPFVYFPLRQATASGRASRMTLLVRTSTPPLTAASAVRAAVRDTAPDLPLVGVGTLEQHVARLADQERLTTSILALSAILALVIAAIGLYAVLAYEVGRRRFEMGLRMALGARPRDVLALVIRRGMTMVALGLAFGIVGILASQRLLDGFLYGIRPNEPGVIVGVVLLFAAVGFAATYLPARSATRADPRGTLQHDR